ncbi:chitinase-3-like protein 2 [Platichthys flesus]|uniref:chitinase-3-like protein 2 n=1 Tax=Platichthys flesus TaxID=8260 RepID=UPI002DB83BC9|nr:chitinase-3-like protein 2 [Platichthys flesus]
MCNIVLTAGLCLVIASLGSSERLVCYFNSLAEDRADAGKFTIEDIDPNKCTHLIYAFSDINDFNEMVPTRRADIFRYQLFNGLKTRNPSLKTLLAVGGPTFNKEKFTTMLSTTQKRTTFIQSAVALLRIFQFDGLNLDWMYPVGAGGDPDNKQKFTLLCKELNAAFETEGNKHNRDRLILTASVSAEREVIDASYEVKNITKDLDFLNVLTYDFHGPWENFTGHHSPLFGGSHDTGDKIYYNTDSAMQYWVDKGAPAQLLNLGLAAYGRAFSLSSASSAVGAPASGTGEEGCYTGEEGFWAYYETCLYTEGATVQRIADQKVPYAITENQWVGFDDTHSISTKVSYLKSKHFGGAFVWSLDLDDFSGKFCNQSKSPFISHLNSLLSKFYDHNPYYHYNFSKDPNYYDNISNNYANEHNNYSDDHEYNSNNHINHSKYNNSKYQYHNSNDNNRKNLNQNSNYHIPYDHNYSNYHDNNSNDHNRNYDNQNSNYQHTNSNYYHNYSKYHKTNSNDHNTNYHIHHSNYSNYHNNNSKNRNRNYHDQNSNHHNRNYHDHNNYSSYNNYSN